MARGLFRKVSFAKTVGAYRSMWKRALLRLFFPGYGMKGTGWLRDPKKAWYNWLYHRTSISIPRLLGYKPSFGGTVAALFVASLFNIALLPADTVKAASKSSKIKKAAKERGSNFGKIKDFEDDKFHEPRIPKATPAKKSEPKENSVKKVEHPTKVSKTSPSVSRSSSTSKPKTAPSVTKTDPKKEYISAPQTTVTRITTDEIVSLTYKNDTPKVSEPPKKAAVIEPDENTPKSVPKNEKDQYIRKRMTIAGSSYCDKTVLDKLEIGMFIDVTAETDNAYDKNAIMLTYEGEKIGYIPKTENLPIATCLRLGRSIYGVITDIKTNKTPTEYEFEVWFDMK